MTGTERLQNALVICNFHKGGCGSSSGVCCDEQEAIDLWNRRVQ